MLQHTDCASCSRRLRNHDDFHLNCDCAFGDAMRMLSDRRTLLDDVAHVLYVRKPLVMVMLMKHHQLEDDVGDEIKEML